MVTKIDYSRHNAMGWLIGCLQQPDRLRPVGPARSACKTADAVRPPTAVGKER